MYFQKFFYSACLIISINLFAQSTQIIELVESIPVETTLDNPDIRNTQEVWLEMINSAKSTLDIEQFYISNEKGEPLDTILNAIVAAANRGVIVRVIIDAGMYQTYPESADMLDANENIEVRKIDIKSLAGGIQHAKYFIVDGREVFLGSQNFDWRALKHIHELGVRIKNEIISEYFSEIYKHDWCFSGSQDSCSFKVTLPPLGVFNTEKFGWLNVMPTYSSFNAFAKILYPENYFFWCYATFLHTRFFDINQITKLIGTAKTEINLQFLSYNPVTKDGYWEEVDMALISATKRGVKVKLLVSDWNLGKTAVEHFKELIQYPNFEVRYTAIPEYSGGFISYARVEHCKFITADYKTWIGTSNMSYDYFYESRNVGLVIENEKFTKRVREIFYKSWDSEYSHPIESTGEYRSRQKN
ncbi:MAG: FAM83 family protein [Ignavibacteria bacterium]|nr:FAM83 family protein [Ignavibacteria bacterium]